MKLIAITILIAYAVSTNGDLLDQPLTDHELDLLIEAVGAMDLMGMSSMRKKEVTHCLTSNKISGHGYGYYGDHRVKRATKGAKEIVSYCFGGSSKKSQAKIGGRGGGDGGDNDGGDDDGGDDDGGDDDGTTTTTHRPCDGECCMELNVIDGDQVSNPDCPEGYGCDALGGNQCFENPCTTARCADAGCEVTQSETEPGPNLHWLAWKCPCINGLLELNELQDYENPFNQIDEECPEGAECCRDNNFIIDDHVSNPDCDVGQLCDAFQGGYECYDNPCLEVNDLNPCESRELCVVLDQPPIFIVADCLCAADEADE